MANCNNQHIGQIPICDGDGLYMGGINDPPAAHLARGLAIAQTIVPLNGAGEPDPAGKLVLAGLGGMSNARLEFDEFARTGRIQGACPIFFNGNRHQWDAQRITDDPSGYWDWVFGQLSKRNITAPQVQVAWVKNSIKGQTEPSPAGEMVLANCLEAILAAAIARFPNLKMIFLSSAIYSGYSTNPARHEPFAYWEGLGVRQVVMSRLETASPWVAWGPYLWADGLTPRAADGLDWLCSDFADDGLHPADGAKSKVAELLYNFFTTFPTTAGWFLRHA